MHVLTEESLPTYELNKARGISIMQTKAHLFLMISYSWNKRNMCCAKYIGIKYFLQSKRLKLLLKAEYNPRVYSACLFNLPLKEQCDNQPYLPWVPL